MSPVSLSLDLLLVVLLIAALGFGWRLDRRLKGLRASHVDFAQAVADLDRAAQRAEVGLAQLREATNEAVDLLAGRIEKARELTTKLDRLTSEAAAAAQRAPLETPRPVPATPRTRPAATAPSSTETLFAAESLARRLSGEGVLELRSPAPPIARPVTQMSPQPMRRPRLSIDDELFEAPVRAAQDGSLRGRL